MKFLKKFNESESFEVGEEDIEIIRRLFYIIGDEFDLYEVNDHQELIDNEFRFRFEFSPTISKNVISLKGYIGDNGKEMKEFYYNFNNKWNEFIDSLYIYGYKTTPLPGLYKQTIFTGDIFFGCQIHLE